MAAQSKGQFTISDSAFDTLGLPIFACLDGCQDRHLQVLALGGLQRGQRRRRCALVPARDDEGDVVARRYWKHSRVGCPMGGIPPVLAPRGPRARRMPGMGVSFGVAADTAQECAEGFRPCPMW